MSSAKAEAPQPTTEMAKHKIYLNKLNFQERVSEEVKKALKPAFAAKTVNKDQYKDIMRYRGGVKFYEFISVRRYAALELWEKYN